MISGDNGMLFLKSHISHALVTQFCPVEREV